jgi:hypothetical protein
MAVAAKKKKKETPRKLLLLLLWLWQAGAWSWRCMMSSMDPIQGFGFAMRWMEFTTHSTPL